jgi:hypothetical protein
MDDTTQEEDWMPPPEENPVEPIRPLVQEARWTSTSLAAQLLTESNAFYAEWSPLQVQPPYAVYHYTDAAGLKGVLESGRLWASDMLYLNASREVTYAYGLMCDHLRRNWNTSDMALNDFCARAEAELDPRRWARSVFLACFCEDGDALTQWRAHTADGGYALGLRTAALENVGVRFQRAALRRVVYSAELQNALLQRLLDRTLTLVRSRSGESAEQRAATSDAAMEFLSDHLIEFVASFKHHTFEQEAEWRLVVVLDTGYAGEGTGQVHFRVADGHPVPYAELDISPRTGPSASPLAEVVCGPVDRSALAARSIQTLLRSRGYAGTRVRTSALSG